jgi:hypothetical protein
VVPSLPFVFNIKQGQQQPKEKYLFQFVPVLFVRVQVSVSLEQPRECCRAVLASLDEENDEAKQKQFQNLKKKNSLNNF